MLDALKPDPYVKSNCARKQEKTGAIEAGGLENGKWGNGKQRDEDEKRLDHETRETPLGAPTKLPGAGQVPRKSRKGVSSFIRLSVSHPLTTH